MNNILNKTFVSEKIYIKKKIFIFSLMSLSFLYNYKLYNENNILKNQKTEMYELCKNSINNQIKYINEIKTQN